MINSMTCNETPQSVTAVRNPMVYELTASNIDHGSSEWWGHLLRELADQQEPGTCHSRRPVKNSPRSPLPCKVATPLARLAGGPYQSIGGFFDYSNWIDRDRFMELDKAIYSVPCDHALELECDSLAS